MIILSEMRPFYVNSDLDLVRMVTVSVYREASPNGSWEHRGRHVERTNSGKYI